MRGRNRNIPFSLRCVRAWLCYSSGTGYDNVRHYAGIVFHQVSRRGDGKLQRCDALGRCVVLTCGTAGFHWAKPLQQYHNCVVIIG